VAYYDEFASGYYTRYPRRQIVGYDPVNKELRSIVVTTSGEIKVNISGQPVDLVAENVAVSSGKIAVLSGEVHILSGEVSIKKATTMSTTVYTITAASGGTQIATTNNNRVSILIQSIALSGDIYIKESALQSGEGIKIMQNGSYTTDKYIGDLWAIAVVSGDQVVVSEEAY